MNTQTDRLFRALESLVPNAQWTCAGDLRLAGIVWTDARPQPTLAQLQAEADRLDATEQSAGTSRTTIEAQAAAAMTDNRAHLARANPTVAQNTAQIKALTRQSNGIIRLLLGRLDGTD